MTPLADQWQSILGGEAPDWSHLGLELRLADGDRTEETVVAIGPLNPWRRDDDYREGILRFRAARTAGYGAAAQLVAERLRLLDSRGIEGALRVIRAVDAARLVSTQGPTF
jgi:hypothetical protein